MGYFAETMANFDAVQSLVEVKGEAESGASVERYATRDTHNHYSGKSAAVVGKAMRTGSMYGPHKKNHSITTPMKTAADYKARVATLADDKATADRSNDYADEKRAQRKAKHESVSIFDSVPL